MNPAAKHQNREGNPLFGERIENHRMPTTHPANLDAKSRAPFAQTQALYAVFEQASVSPLQVKLPQGDLCEVCDQPRDLKMLLLRQVIGPALQLWRGEHVNLVDEMRQWSILH